MKKKRLDPEPSVYRPKVFDFGNLFHKWVAEKDCGIPEMSSILLNGSPGAGKSFFALAFARGIQFSALEEQSERLRIYYVSTEVSTERLQRNFDFTGWFPKAEEGNGGDPLFGIRSAKINREDRFVPIILPLELGRPAPTTEEMVNALIAELRRQHAESQEGTKGIVIVDSLTAILRDCEGQGQKRRQTHEFLHRLAGALGERNLAISILISEEPKMGPPPEVAVEDYVVDFVFRLALKDTGMGRRLRTLEVMKTHGTMMRVGEHTWAILSKEGIKGVVVPPTLQSEIRNLATGGRNEVQKWATIAIFPAASMPAIGKTPIDKKPDNSIPTLHTGVPGLDEMLDFKNHMSRQYWIDSELDRYEPTSNPPYVLGLLPDATTVIVGQAGSGKTNMCLQFLLAHGNTKQTLFVNFESPFEEVSRRYPGSEMERDSLKFCHQIFRRRGNLDVNALLAEMLFVIKRHRIKRVAIDGLSNLLSTTAEADYSRLIETLLSALRSTDQPLPIFITHEPESATGVGHTEIPRLSAVADNLVVVKAVTINDQLRQAIYVVKARGLSHDRSVREVRIAGGRDNPVGIYAGLETFTGVLEGNPRPVSLALQLFHENTSETNYIHELEDRLHGIFNYEVKFSGFSRTAIARAMDDLVSPTNPAPASNVRVISLDEWMVRDICLTESVTRRSNMEDKEPPLMRLTPFERPKMNHGQPQLRAFPGTFEGDFWVWDILKCGERPMDRRARSRSQTPPLLSLPLYLDFGLFCISGCCWPGDNNISWSDLVQRLPCIWAERDSRWFRKPDPERARANAPTATLIDYMSWAVNNGKHQQMAGRDGACRHGFLFDLATPETAASVLLELAWGFGAKEGVFADLEHPTQTVPHAASEALMFLMFLVKEGLMPLHGSLSDTRHSLFSRHYYSTFVENKENELGSNATPAMLTILPFMPEGMGSCQDGSRALKTNLLRDVSSRAQSFLPAIAATIETRNGRYNKKLRDVFISKTIPPFLSIDETRALHDDAISLPALQLDSLAGAAGTTRSGAASRYAGALDGRDVVQYLHRQEIRKVICGEITESGAWEQTLGFAAPAGRPWPAGYCCTGSWMVGVHSETHSPGLSCQLIAEMTSLESNLKRARMGAGLPARKDFYERHGHENVTHAPYLNWRNFLSLCGSRARERTLAIPPTVSVRDMNRVLHREILSCLAKAATGAPPRELITFAERSVLRIIDEFKHLHEMYEHLQDEQKQPGRKP